MEVSGQRHAPAALPPGKTQYPLYRSLGGPQGRSGRVWKISPRRDFIPEPSSSQPVAIPTALHRSTIFLRIRLLSEGREGETFQTIEWYSDIDAVLPRTVPAHWFFRYLTPGFDLRPVQVGFEVSKMALKKLFFSPGTLVFPGQYHSTNAPYSASTEYVPFRRTSGWSLGELSNRPMSIRISGKQWSGIHNPVPAHCISNLRHSTNQPPPKYPQDIMLLVAEVLGMGTSRPCAKTGNPLAKHNPRYSCKVSVPQHNNAFRNQERPPSAGLQRQLTFGWVTKSYSCLSPLCCADQITWYLSCIQQCSARSGHCLVPVGTTRATL